ncbi:Similar to EME1: Crossover junction endonuclease EME1 (Pongo abelii) [Cotesia congregata]|uniref:Similar to EME1: Crossover junction endonuclease EME1 (Pongo abelii) n=1 Tax=Cotesia congregata TaxID=51543 RepID=A0A8J2EL76_COTCN|nr:Similar to EME1: Crossover junction endonuclease EME1 (Pongo abelii) [Cotesia congregata]
MDLSDIDEEYTGFANLNYKNNNYICDLSSDENDSHNYNKNKQKSSMKKNNQNVLSSPEIPTSKVRSRKKKTTAVNEDKVREKKEAARVKLELKLEKKRIKNIEPGECLKFITINFHNEICKFNFYNETLSILDASSVKYSTKLSSVPNSISWTRTVEDYSLDYDNKINTSTIEVNQKYLLIIWKWDKVIQLINDKLFVSSVISLCNSSAKMNLTLVIYGVEKYFEYHESKGKKKANSKIYETIDNVPKVSRKVFDVNLIQIQLQAKCNSRLIDEAADMSLLIYQYTKSIAEIPYKLEMDSKLNDQLDFFASGDNRNTIQVDKEGYGLKKLWLKQLCIFNNSSLAVADAISSVYPSPQQLIEVIKFFIYY